MPFSGVFNTFVFVFLHDKIDKHIIQHNKSLKLTLTIWYLLLALSKMTNSLLFLLLEVEPKLVLDPRVGVRALFACDEVPLFPQLPGEELAHMGQVACLLFDGDGSVALLLPAVESGHLRLRGGVAHPLEHLPCGYHPHVGS